MPTITLNELPSTAAHPVPMPGNSGLDSVSDSGMVCRGNASLDQRYLFDSGISKESDLSRCLIKVIGLNIAAANTTHD